MAERKHKGDLPVAERRMREKELQEIFASYRVVVPGWDGKIPNETWSLSL